MKRAFPKFREAEGIRGSQRVLSEALGRKQEGLCGFRLPGEETQQNELGSI